MMPCIWQGLYVTITFEHQQSELTEIRPKVSIHLGDIGLVVVNDKLMSMQEKVKYKGREWTNDSHIIGKIFLEKEEWLCS